MADSLNLNDGICSEEVDNEIYIGELTLEEIKQVFTHRHTFGGSQSSSHILEEVDDSIKIIETRSEPDHFSESFQIPCYNEEEICSNVASDVGNNNNDQDKEELDNTLDIIDKILKQGQNENKEDCSKKLPDYDPYIVKKEIQNEKEQSEINHPAIIKAATPKSEMPLKSKNATPFSTPLQHNIGHTNVKNELLKPDVKTPVFKTPMTGRSSKLATPSSRKKYARNNAYDHIASPVASYIKNSPQVPLVSDVRPKIPLPVTKNSSIPKLVSKTPSQINFHNKENLHLPSVAYRNAKQTRLINVPSPKKLPESEHTRKIVSSLPRPVVIRHESRENNHVKNSMLSFSEQSFADLPMHQADVSVCTKKSAFCNP